MATMSKTAAIICEWQNTTAARFGAKVSLVGPDAATAEIFGFEAGPRKKC